MLTKLFRAFILLFFPVVFGGGLIWLYTQTGSYRPTTADYKVKVIVGKEEYLVPVNYIWGGHQSVMKGANFHMLYPGAEPRTDQNKQVFDGLGWGGGRLVSFLMNPKEGMGFMDGYRQAEKDAQEKKQIKKDGDWLQIPYMDGIQLLKKNSVPDEIYIVCKQKTEIVKDPSCHKYFSLTRSTYVHFNFSRDRLEEWQQIETELTTLLNKFRINN